jgi:beta-N-acetylhexosaminidase
MAHDTARLVGQSLMLQFRGPTLTAEVQEAMRRILPAGVVLFSNNIEGYQQVYDLITALQQEAKSLDLPPLVIAIDQEGGTVSRLPLPFVTVPSPMAQAATGEPGAAEVSARISGEQMRNVGITMNFAPSLDVNNQPANPVIRTRAFSDNPGVVSRFGLAALRGYVATNVIATVKHFPGHGDTAVDSHHGLPVVSHQRAHLDAVELAPFVAAINAGVPAVMTAHIIFDAFDDKPATLSPAVLTGLLRRELAFKGLIVTDAMDMRAIVDRYGHTDAAIAAKAAGADVLEMVDTLDRQMTVAAGLRNAVDTGVLSADGFHATIDRLTALRTAYDIRHTLPPLRPLNPALHDEALSIARRSITIVRNAASIIPLSSATRLCVIDCQKQRSSLAEDPADRIAAVRDAAKRTFPNATYVAVDAEPPTETVAEAARLADSSDATLFLTRDAATHAPHAELGRRLSRLQPPLIHAAVRAPYDARLLPDAAAVLLTYGDPPVSLQALIDVVSGAAQGEGIAPVALDAARFQTT